MIQLRLTTNPGIEDIVEQEIKALAVRWGYPIIKIQQQPFGLQGQVFVDSPDPRLSKIALQARSLFHVMRQIHHFSLESESDPLKQIYAELLHLDIPEMNAAQTFRVTTERSGKHLFRAMDIQRLAGSAINQHYGTAVSLDDYEVNVRVDIYDRLCLVSLQENRVALDQRHTKVWQPRITLKTTIAYGMLQLCQLEEKTRLLDPFCGSGTILIEAATIFPHLSIYGSDRREEAVTGVKKNIHSLGQSAPVHIQQGDARDLAQNYPQNYFQAIVTNPPYGMHLGSEMDFYRLYLKFLQGIEQVLEPGGRLVLLVGKGYGAFKKIISQQGTFMIQEDRLVKTGGLYPHLLVCDRVEDEH